MQAEREEWLESQQANSQNVIHKHNGATSSHIINMLQQASVKQKYLTNDENWDYYLSLIQSWIEKTKTSAGHFRNALESPECVNRDEREKIKNYLMICNERIGTLEAVIALPNQIIEDHEHAELDIAMIPAIKV